MNDPVYPKVLILIQPFNTVLGGGITLTNLFKGWPKDRIAVAGLSGLIDFNTKTDICDTYYQLGSEEVSWKWPLSVVKRKYFSGLVNFTKDKQQIHIPKKAKWRSNLGIEYVDPFLIKTGLYEALYRIDLSDRFKQWLKDYDPDIIYAQAQNRGRTLFCTRVQRFLGKPMVFHMMDDWLELVKEQGLFGDYWYRKANADFREMLRHCSLHLAISDGMATEYKRRYGFDFKAFHNPIEYEFWHKGQKQSYDLGTPPTVLYAGRTGLGIEASLILMAKAIDQINRNHGLGIKFVLQSSSEIEWAAEYGFVERRAFVAYDDLPFRFGEADVLFLPYDFNKKAVSFIKYSMPTKASEYMASGTPILILAPEETALSKYARDWQWAELIVENTVEKLAYGLLNLITDIKKRQALGVRAASLANERHEAGRVRELFRKELAALVK